MEVGKGEARLSSVLKTQVRRHGMPAMTYSTLT